MLIVLPQERLFI